MQNDVPMKRSSIPGSAAINTAGISITAIETVAAAPERDATNASHGRHFLQKKDSARDSATMGSLAMEHRGQPGAARIYRAMVLSCVGWEG